MSHVQGTEVRRPSRRTIAAGAAWAVPVIVVGAAAPAMAASPNIIFELDPDVSCKFPGQSTEWNHGYSLAFTITATEAGVVCLTDISAPNNTAAEVEILQVIPGGGTDNCRPILPGETQIVVIIGAENSANGTAIFTYSFQGVTGTFTATITNFHPCERTLP